MSCRVDNTGSRRQYYVRPGNGKLIELCVQSFQDSLQLPKDARWTRIGKPSCRIPSQTILSHRIWSSALIDSTEERKYTISTALPGFLKSGVSLQVFFGFVGAVNFLDFWSSQSPFQILSPREEHYDAVPSSDRELESFSTQAIRPGLRVGNAESSGQDLDEAADEPRNWPGYAENLRLSSDLRPAGTTAS